MHLRTTRPIAASTVALVALAAMAGLSSSTASATVEPGTPARDVHIGLDDDDADNPLIQPPGVAAPQHMDDTDVLFGRANADLLIGRRGGDTLLGGPGPDILVGGPDTGSAPGNDVLVGDTGDDVSIWSPGDGNDAFVGNQGSDVQVMAPLVRRADGRLLLTRDAGRRIPHVDIHAQPSAGCSLVPVPATRAGGFEHLVRYTVDGVPVATVRVRDVERVFCPAPRRGWAYVADLTAAHPALHNVRLTKVSGYVAAILAPVG